MKYAPSSPLEKKKKKKKRVLSILGNALRNHACSRG